VPGDLASLTIEDCISSVVEQITAQGTGPLMLVGHSLAGVIMGGVVRRLGAEKVQHVIFVACCVPKSGESVVDTLPFGLRQVVRHIVERSPVITSPRILVRYAFSNCATAEQRAQIRAQLVPESSALVTQAFAADVPRAIRKSWVLTGCDRALPPAKQRGFIENLGGVDELVCIDAGHEVMITHPSELARAIVQLAFSPPAKADEATTAR